MSGKTDGICAFQHPKPCPRLLANGTNRRRGCNKGNRCQFFHPQMCYRSLSERICARADCHFMHVKGTKRGQPDYIPELSANYEPVNHTNANFPHHLQTAASRQHRSPPSVTPPQHRSPPSVTPPENHFLDYCRKFEEQLTKITAKLQQLDSNYTQLSQQQAKPQSIFQTAPQYQIPQPYYPHLFPPPMQMGAVAAPVRH